MKKRLFGLLVICLICSYAKVSAQGYSYPGFHFGLRGGYTINSLAGDGSENLKNKNNLYGGLAMDFRLGSIPLYLETGVYYMNKGYVIGIDKVYPDYTTVVSYFENTHNANFFHAPLLISYHYYVTDDMAIQPFFGGYGGYSTELDTEDYGIRFGCGFNWKRLYVNVGYDYGLCNVVDKKTAKLHANTLILTLGFNIVGAR